MSFTRSVLIDDTDPRIVFRGNWTAKSSSFSWGGYGSPYNLTLHESASGGTVIFPFRNASYVSIYGNIDTVNHRPKPYWYCALDRSFGNRTEPSDAVRMSYYPLCEFQINDGGEHQLTVNITVPSGGIIEIDAIQVVPAKDISVIEGEVLKIQDTDPTVVYSPSDAWTVGPEPSTHDTRIYGSSVQFDFTGSGIQLIGIYQDSKTQSTGTYRLDDGPTKTFVIPAVRSPTYNNVLFTEQGLSAINHSLNVTFTGEGDGSPLRLSSFYVTLPPGQSPLISSAKTIEFSAQSNHNRPVGAIVGAVVGGVVALALLATYFWWRCYRRHQSRRNTTINPFIEKPRRSDTPHTAPMMHVHPLESNTPYGESGERQLISDPNIFAFDPRRVETVHEGRGHRPNGTSTSRVGDLEILDIPPVYSPI